MNAILARKADVEDSDMASDETGGRAGQVGELRSDVRHVQSDVTDIKAEIRVVNQRFDRVDQKFDEVNRRLDDLRASLASAKLWALGLHMGQAGTLLYVLARGLKWL
jgi:hypothetical protein